MLMFRHDAAGAGLGLFAFILLLLYFHRRTPPPQGGAAMVAVSSTLLPADDGSAVPVEINDDERTGPLKPEEFHRLFALSESADCAIPVVVQDNPTRRVAVAEIARLAEQSHREDRIRPAHITEQSQLDESDLDAQLLNVELRACRRMGEACRENGLAT